MLFWKAQLNEAGNIKGTNLAARSRDAQKLGIVRDQLQALVNSKIGTC
jgi:hypothetical protein